jgi:hypothetical protein
MYKRWQQAINKDLDHMKKVLQILSLTILISCIDNNDDSTKIKLSGRYEIISITSQDKRDLNNDGQKTNNIYAEISDKHNSITGDQFSYYDFTLPTKYLTINNNIAMNIIIPDQDIDTLTNGTVFQRRIIDSVTIYSIEFNASAKAIKIINANVTLTDNIITKIDVLDNGQLKVRVSKKLFDFVDLKWTDNIVTVTFERVD